MTTTGQLITGTSSENNNNSIVSFKKRNNDVGTHKVNDLGEVLAQFEYDATVDEFNLNKRKTSAKGDSMSNIMKVQQDGSIIFNENVTFNGGSTTVSSTTALSEARHVLLGSTHTQTITSANISGNPPVYKFNFNTALSTETITLSTSASGLNDSNNRFTTDSAHNLHIGDYIKFTNLNSEAAFTNANNNFQLLDNSGTLTGSEITTSSIFSVLTTPTPTSFTLGFINSSTNSTDTALTFNTNISQNSGVTLAKYEGFRVGEYVFAFNVKDTTGSTFVPITNNSDKNFSNSSAKVSAVTDDSVTISHLNISGTDTALSQNGNTLTISNSHQITISRLSRFTSETGLEILGLNNGNNKLLQGSLQFKGDNNDTLELGNCCGNLSLKTEMGDITATVADGKELKLGNADGDAYFKVAPSDTFSNEKVEIKNSNGTNAAAIAITASSGGVDIDAHTDKEVNIAGGQVALVSKDNTPGAISLTANVGTSETITITNTKGTNNGAITLNASAGGVDIDAAGQVDIDSSTGSIAIGSSLVDGQTLKLGKNGATEMIFSPHGTIGSEKITLTNTSGNDGAAIKLESKAGGIDLEAASNNQIELNGGQVHLQSRRDVQNAISLTTNVGNTETITVTNTQGNSEKAIELKATAGGVDIDAAASRDVNITGGQIALESKDNTAGAISLTTNQGNSETITITNKKSIQDDAIALTATRGGIKAKVCDDKELILGNANSNTYFRVAPAVSASSEKVEIKNTKGTDNEAIALTALNGGISAKVADGKELKLGNSDGNAYFKVAPSSTADDEKVEIKNTQGTNNEAIALSSVAGGISATVADGKELKLGNAEGDAYFKVAPASTESNDKVEIKNSKGENNDAIALIALEGGITAKVANGKQLILGNDVSDAYFKVAPSSTAGDEKVEIKNTQGISDGAIAINAVNGGVDIDANLEKDVNISGGKVILGSKKSTTGAISLITDKGSNETITITNKQGNGNNAIELKAEDGGVDIDAATTKDVNISGGQVILESKQGVENAISLTTNVGTTETITVTNTKGINDAAIALTALAGGISLTAADGKSVKITNDEASTSHDTGSFQVAGGVGIGGDLHVQGNITGNISGTIQGSAAQVTVTTDNGDDNEHFLAFVSNNSGNQAIEADSNLKYNPFTNTLTADTFSGNANTATTATDATNATNVNVTNGNTTNSDNFLTFVNSNNGGNLGVETNSNLKYNPITKVLTTDKFKGNLEGTADSATSADLATNATNINVTESSKNVDLHLTFVEGSTGNQPIEVDTDLTYKPSTNTLSTGNFVVDDEGHIGSNSTHQSLQISELGNITIKNNEEATSAVTGALRVMGGIGVVKDSFFSGTITSVGTITSSDRTLKENISTLEDPSDLVSKINVVSYSYISDRNNQNANKMRIGVIAQEVNEIFPNTVHSDNSGKLAVDYTSLFCALIKTVQVQKNTIHNLETEISNIKKHLNM